MPRVGTGVQCPGGPLKKNASLLIPRNRGRVKVTTKESQGETTDAAFEKSRWDAPKAPLKFSKWGQVSGQGQVKSQNRGFQVTSRRDLKIISFWAKTYFEYS